MIQSMTGYGKASGQISNKKFFVEIKSLNSKSLDLSVRLPSIYNEKEIELRTLASNTIVRGKINLSIYYDADVAEKETTINTQLVDQYLVALKKVADQIGESDAKLLPHILKMPEIIITKRLEMDENEWQEIVKLVHEAIDKFIEFRVREGKELSNDIELRTNNILSNLNQIIATEGVRVDKVKERLETKLLDVVDRVNLDRNRLEQEIIYFLEKMDITEEVVRLKTHCDYFVKTLNSDVSEGRKLGFISQEIGREINTIGSKSNDAGMQKIVVQMKDELEKIKEQLLNIL